MGALTGPSQPSEVAGRQSVEWAICLVLLLMFSEGLLPRLLSPEQDLEGSPILRLLWLPAYALIAALAALRFQHVARVVVGTPFLCALVALALASTLWSVDPALTARRAAAVAATTLFGLYLAARWDWTRLLTLLGVMWLGLAGASLAAGLAAPSFGVVDEIHVGAWRGVWWEKNAFGSHMAQAALIFGVLAFMTPARRRVWLCATALAGALVLLSTSKTALVALLVAGAALGFGVLSKRGPALAIPAIAIALCLGAVAAVALATAPDAVAGLIGRDATLTGRTEIWAALEEPMSTRPWVGFGYGAFWAVDSEPAYWIRRTLEWEAPTAHNGWIELRLGLGFAGLALFAGAMAQASRRAVVDAARGWGGVFAAAFLVQFAVFSLSESNALQQNAIGWATFAAVSGRLALGRRLSRTSGVGRRARPTLARQSS